MLFRKGLPHLRRAELFLVNSRQKLFDSLTKEVEGIETRLSKEVLKDERAKLLMTHSGIGPLTALAVVHTLGDVNRFSRKEEIGGFAA